MTNADFSDRFALRFVPSSHRRIIAGKEVILHCHHYNSRIQRTVESAGAIDGKGLLVSTAEAVFREHIESTFRADDDLETRWAAASALYSHLGYGSLDLARVGEGLVVAPTSHFSEGWRAGFPDRDTPACSFTEGFLQAAIHAVTGETVHVREEQCTVQGAPECVFRLDSSRNDPLTETVKTHPTTESVGEHHFVTSPSVDAGKIVEALVAMPILGNEEGLIPAFNVYLASTPADFYNLLCLGFVEEMEKVGLGGAAREQLIYDAETCGMNTFRGIMSSPEWDALVAPMIKEPGDALFGIIAVSNALGWGNWHVRRYEPGESLELVSLNGYEATGTLEYRGRVNEPACLMLTGVAAGIMELIHGVGSLRERFGQFSSSEQSCRASDGSCCVFEVEDAA